MAIGGDIVSSRWAILFQVIACIFICSDENVHEEKEEDTSKYPQIPAVWVRYM